MTKEQRKAWRLANPDKHRAEQRLYYARHTLEVGLRVSKTRSVHSNNRRARKLKSDGSFTSAEWKSLCRKYKHRCLCCGKRSKLTHDHVVPLSKGGSNSIDNIQPLCMPCNASKHTGTTDFRVCYHDLGGQKS